MTAPSEAFYTMAISAVILYSKSNFAKIGIQAATNYKKINISYTKHTNT